ncbi:hypothetical protein HOC35_04880 [Candidatus Woesearchaeota archaeon]|jgi:hypothetical protein|nr:hypothetical protein [Candidatus Woesearchaeota archaeon]
MKFDLIIIDIDDTFLPHRTVSVGYKLFWQYLGNFFCLKLFRLSILGLKLYLAKCFREVKNKFRNEKFESNKKLINIWGEGIVRLGINAKDYEISENRIKEKLFKKTLKLLDVVRKENPTAYVVAITQSFNLVNEKDKLIKNSLKINDPITKVLGIDELYSNVFYYGKEGIIVDKELLIKNGFDKLDIAEKVMKKINAKNVGLFIDDYDDLKLLGLKGNVQVVYTGWKIRKFADKKLVISN